jgi:putative membrane protein insertion efficiency factor
VSLASLVRITVETAEAPEAAEALPDLNTSVEAASPGCFARALLRLIRLYQWARRGRPSPCRYLPSCSEYAAIAVDRHGAARGGWLAVRRLCRCHPWGGYGADPVPERPGVRNPS